MANRFNTKYAVGLAPLKNSFFDPESGCNLFRSTPVYAFNHPPTRYIKDGVKYGSLVDLVGNVLGEEVVVNTATPSNVESEDTVDKSAKSTSKSAKAKDK